MALPNGRATTGGTFTPSTLSPKSFSPTNGVTSSTLDDASLDELDRIMDTLSTLSREASLARGPHAGKKYTLPSPPGSENTGQRSYPTGSESTTPYSATSPRSTTSPTRGFPVPVSVPIPPPITSPPETPVAQSPRYFTPHPKIMTMSALPSHQPTIFAGMDKARNPATVPRLPSNPYENTSILHGSHMVRPSTLTNETPRHPESPYVNKTPSNAAQGQYFFGPLPISPQDVASGDHYPPTAGSKPMSMIPHSLSDETTNRRDRNAPQHRGELRPSRPGNNNFDQSNRQQQESHTLPAYNEKRSYLKNLEEGTLPRPRVESARQGASSNVTPTLGRKHTKHPKQSFTEEAGEALNRLSLRRQSKNSSKRQHGRFGVNNMSKTPSRHSTTSFNSFDLGRGYASVSTAPASTHGLIQHEVLPHRSRKMEQSPLINTESPDSGKEEEDEGCCIRCGRFLYSHILELFILVAFCAGLPAGIVIQATGFHTTTQFENYYCFWGSNLLPMLLSTITPMLIVSSVLTGMGNLTTNVLKRLTLLSALIYTLSTFAAVCIAIAFSFIIRPGSPVVFNVTASAENSSYVGAKWTLDAEILLGNTFLRDDGLSVNAFTESNLFFNATSVGSTRVSDEILNLIRFFFPGCGAPAVQDTGAICNVFVLVLFSGLIGIGASIMELEGGPIRHVLSQVGTVLSNMADILLWYVPVGVFFYVSEIVATKIDWTNIGHDRQLEKNIEQNFSDFSAMVVPISSATQRFFITVVSSLAIYCLLIMPLVASLITLSNPFSLMGFRSVSPLLTAVTVGFSDLCVPVTLRCLLKGNGNSRCYKPLEKVDRRIARTSAVTGGIFHRAGSAIIITCSATFLLQIQGEDSSIGTMVLICISAMATSVTLLGGRWFYGTDPFLKATIICLSTASISHPSAIPKNIFCLWFISRLAAFTDTFVDLLTAQIVHKACRSMMRDITDDKPNSKGERTTDSSHADNRVREMVILGNKMAAARSTSGETSDYEEAPLLFNRSGADTGNESSSMNSRNDDSVFLPSRPQDSRANRPTRHGVTQRGEGNRNDMNGVSNPGASNRDEVAFVTF